MIVVLIVVAFLAFLAGFFVSCLFSAGAEEERRLEFMEWMDERERLGAGERRDGDDG